MSITPPSRSKSSEQARLEATAARCSEKQQGWGLLGQLTQADGASHTGQPLALLR